MIILSIILFLLGSVGLVASGRAWFLCRDFRHNFISSLINPDTTRANIDFDRMYAVIELGGPECLIKICRRCFVLSVLLYTIASVLLIQHFR